MVDLTRVGGRMVFFTGVLFTDVTARIDVIVESFFVFVATGVEIADFFAGVMSFVDDMGVRMGNFEAFFTDNER